MVREQIGQDTQREAGDSDTADAPTIYRCAIAICNMRKAHIRANNYY